MFRPWAPKSRRLLYPPHPCVRYPALRDHCSPYISHPVCPQRHPHLGKRLTRSIYTTGNHSRTYRTLPLALESPFRPRSGSGGATARASSYAVPETSRRFSAPAVFVDPNTYYPETEITEEAVLGEMAAMSPEFEPWADMALRVRESPPRAGDFVEFRAGSDVRFGILLAPPPCLFNQFHNRSIILTMHNELVRACPQDYTSVYSQVLREELVPAADVLRNRFDEFFPARRRLVQYLHQFLVLVAGYRRSVDMSRVYAAAARPETASVSLYEVAAEASEKLPNREGCPSASPHDRLRQNALLMALYLDMCANPADWIVPVCYEADRVSNVSAHHSSNALPASPVFLANSLSLSSTLDEFLHYSEPELSHISTVLSAMLDDLRHRSRLDAFERVSVQLSTGSAQLKKAVAAVKYGVVYPHAALMAQLGKISALGPDPTPRTLYAFLVDLGLYDNPCNPLTDPLLSSQVLGSTLSHIATHPRDLQPRSSAFARDKEAFHDHFSHLRPSGSSRSTQKVYVLPGSHGTMAFSLDQLNSRRYILHVHVMDLATRIAPSSAAFRAWAANPAENLGNMAAQMVHDYMQSPGISGRLGVAGEPEQTCMTLSFEYRSSFEDSMADFANLVDVSFDRLAIHRMVEISPETLEKTLTGKLEPSVFKRFRLFGHKAAPKPDPVSDEVHYELNFVYNMMRRHFESRNRHSGLNVAAKRVCRTSHKKLTVVDNHVHTELNVGESGPEKSGFLRQELEIFAGRMASAFAERLAVPVYRRWRRLVFPDPRPESDEVLICHDNSLLPDYTSNAYDQAAYSRDVTGHVSLSAFFHASSFVGFEEIAVGGRAEGMAHVTLGVTGYARIIPYSVEAYINQLQILQALHFRNMGRLGIYEKARGFSHLKALGYNLHGPSEITLLGNHAETLAAADRGSKYLREKHMRYWKLKAVEMHPERFRRMKCTVTRVSRDIDMQDGGHGPGSRIHVFCEDLGLEAVMYTEPETKMTLGSPKTASVYHVDAISGQLILA